MLTENLIAIMASIEAAKPKKEMTECRYLWRDPKHELPHIDENHKYSEDCLLMVFEEGEDPIITVAYRILDGDNWRWFVPSAEISLSKDQHLAWMFMPPLKEYELPSPVEIK